MPSYSDERREAVVAKARAERRKKPRSGRKRGAQPGHPGQARLMTDAVDHIEPYYPDGHCACGGVVERMRS